MKDFFVSYNRYDRAWAEWIAWILEEVGYSVVIQDWDFRPGGNFVLDMQRATTEAERTIAVLSENYLQSLFTQPEWAAAFAQDPTGEKRSLIPIRVEECKLSGLLAQIVHVDLVGVNQTEAQKIVLRSVQEGRTKPDQKPSFPERESPNVTQQKPVFPPQIVHNLPLASLTFVGREAEVDELHEQFQQSNQLAITSIQGMGGIGKTELALQYALQYKNAGAYPGGLCWLNAREEVGTLILKFARVQLQINLPEEKELPEQIAACWQNWQTGDVLVIYDDVADYDHIQPFLPPNESRFKVLLTTRLTLGKSFKQLELHVLSEQAALELLGALARKARIQAEAEAAKALCAWLGYLPLALETIGRYLARKPDLSIQKLQERLEQKRLEAQAFQAMEPGMTASRNVVAAFELSWQDLTVEAQRLAMLLSLFAHAEIEWTWVRQCLPDWDEEELEDLRDESLMGLHLLSRTGQGQYQLHQLLREFFEAKQKQTDATLLKTAFVATMAGVARQIPGDPTLEQIQSVMAAIPHLQIIARSLTNSLSDGDLLCIFEGIIHFYTGQGFYKLAEPWGHRCLNVTQERFGESHPDVGTSFNNLALLYHLQGHYGAAKPLYQKALAMSRSLLGENHPDVAANLCNLASLYRSQGRCEEAELLYQQALELHRSSLDKNHPDVAASLCNLASLYHLQGRYEEAEPLCQQALQIYQSLFGESHPHIATILKTLADLYHVQGRYEEAETLYQRALKLNRSLLGENHPNVATNLHDLAALYEAQGRYKEAEPLYQEALAMIGSLLGKNHPDVAANLQGLAVLYQAQGRYKEAEALYQKVLELHRSLLGENHPNVARSLYSLGVIYGCQGCYKEAELLHQKALAMSRSLLGENHPDVAANLQSLASLYQLQGCYEEAKSLCEQALALRQSLLGENHPDVATSLNTLAQIYRAQGHYATAEQLYQKILKLRQSLLGENHPDVAQSLNNLAFIHHLRGCYKAAEPLYQKALELYRSLLGENHPDVAVSIDNLAALYHSQEHYEAAKSLYQQSLELRRTLFGESHPDIGYSLNNLAALYANTGCYAAAEPLLVQALEIWQQFLGDNHPNTVTTRESLEYLRQKMNENQE